ncbi:sialidase family protein [Actinosynnema sp. ALI-1.44]|uniref:sialidase family protein n=1 Tax=Actinosynnema sp. ALI-1.44 TaxID=1933779 RepID=UPI001EDA4078|nr:sialidase family protein [Actinosynnema sp. ALI-1.44]
MSSLLFGATAHAGDGSVRVSGPSPFPAGCGETGPGTLYRNAEVQPHLAVNPRNPAHLVATYQQDRWSTFASQGVLAAASFDGGRTWRRSVPPTSECSGGTNLKRATDSWVAVGPDSTAYLATLAMTKPFFEPGSEHAIQVSRSGDGGLTWGQATVLTRDGGPSVFNDLPAVTADPLDPRLVYVVWTRIELLGGTDFTGTTRLARSTDGGRTWEPPKVVHDPGRNSQTVANKIVVRPDGSLVNAYTRYYPAPDGTFKLEAAVVRSADRGRTWSAPSKVADVTPAGVKDPETGTPIRDGSSFVQVAAGGRDLYIAWQDSRFSGGTRDGVVVSRSGDGGSTWSAPVQVSANAFAPALAVRRDGMVGVSYHDLRDNTSDPTTLPANLRLATSRDGVRWSHQRVASFDYAGAPVVGQPASLYLGDYYGLVASGNAFVPLFAMANKDQENRSDVHISRVQPKAGL